SRALQRLMSAVSTPFTTRESSMSTTVSQIPTAQQQAIAGLTGYEDPDTLRWQQACVQAAQQLTGDSGRLAGVDQGRLARALDLAQHGAVTLVDDGDSYEVRSGKTTYTFRTGHLCACQDQQRYPQILCKHGVAATIHTGALGLMPPAPALPHATR